VDPEGIAGKGGSSFLLSPGLGTRYGLTEKLDLDAGFRFPLAISQSGHRGGHDLQCGRTLQLLTSCSNSLKCLI